MAYRKNPMRIYIGMVVIAATVLIVLKGGPSWYENWLNTPIDFDEAEKIMFEIESGESGRTVSANLAEEGFISNHWLFYWYLKNNDLGGSIQAGRFDLSISMTPIEIAEAITAGSGDLTVTIPEGWTIEQIDDKLYELGLIQDDQFKNCTETCPFTEEWKFLENASSLEGYLFPDTYFVDPASFTSEGFIHTLLYTFEVKVLTTENLETIENRGRTLDEVVIMASIVEREALWEEDHSIIAGILWKRYDSGWALDADSTLLYVLDEYEDLVSNLDLDSLYNTRKYRDLPPTAISNPGLTSFEAALNPESSDYWFYLTDLETGKAHYAEANDEHNANKAEWL